MKILLTLFLVSSIACSNSQNGYEKYDELDREGMLQFVDKEFERALDNFEKAIKLKPKEDVSIYFYATAAALNLGRIDKAKELLTASIHNTNTSKDYFFNFKEFDDFRHEKMFVEVENEYENHISEFYNNLKHPEIYKEIDSLVAVDQEYRTNIEKRKEMAKIDSLNIQRLIEITKEYGWQPKAWIILWHQRGTYGQSNYVWDFFKPYIDEQIANGTMRKSFWTMYEEEKSIMDTKEQIYGLYWGQFDQFPIKDIENVDKRRTEKGLAPLWYLEKVYGIILPEAYERS